MILYLIICTCILGSEIHVTFPQKFPFQSPAKKCRYAGYVKDCDTLFLNGKAVKIYPTGAFVGRYKLKKGKNKLVFSKDKAQKELTRTVTINYKPDTTGIKKDEYRFDPASCFPQENVEMIPGDILDLECISAPGRKIEFKIEGISSYIPMKSVPDTLNRKKGLYQAQFKIPAKAIGKSGKIIYRFADKSHRAIRMKSKGTITVTDRFPCLGRVKEPYTRLKTGLTEERLGGSSLFTVDEDTFLTLTGKRGKYYRVKLSETLNSWVEADDVLKYSVGYHLKPVKIHAMSIMGSENEETVRMHIDRNVPFNIEEQGNTLLLNIYGAQSNTTWVTQKKDTELIGYTSWKQLSTTHYQLSIELKQNLWGFYGEYQGKNQFVLHLKKKPKIDPAQPLKNIRIGVDPGHNGHKFDRGAIGPLGIPEKKLTWEIAEKVEAALKEKGAIVLLSRNKTDYVPFKDRKKMIGENQVDLWLSIHANSIGSSGDPLKVQGASTYYDSKRGHQLSRSILSEMTAIGFKNFGQIGSFNFSPLAMTHCPTALLEAGFLTHPEEEALLIDPQWQTKIANSIAQGISHFLQQEEQNEHR